MISITLYTRQNCSLCEEAQAQLESLQSAVPHELILVDVDGDPKLAQQYGSSLPVIVAGPYTLKAPIDPKDLEITLKAVQHRERQIAKIDADIASGQITLNLAWTCADRFSLWMGKHYLAFLSGLVALYLFGAFLPALLMKANMPLPANALYKVYSFVCHQLPFRSWFLFGEQAAYPRQLAQVPGLITFQQATGIGEGLSPEEIWIARAYVGDEHIGYKVALCQRDVAIYASIILFAALFSIWRRLFPNRPIRPMHWVLWILIGMIPMGLDGGTQLISQYFIVFANYLPLRESTPFLRTLTGFLFGFTTAWFGVPYMEESFADTLRVFERKKMLFDQQERANALPPS